MYIVDWGIDKSKSYPYKGKVSKQAYGSIVYTCFETQAIYNVYGLHLAQIATFW